MPRIKSPLGYYIEVPEGFHEFSNMILDSDPQAEVISGDSSKPQEVIVKEESFDLDKVIEYTGNDKVEKVDFRPQDFKEFIGQGLAKRRISRTLKRINKGMKTHIFLDAIRGHGKSTMARIIAKELKADLIEITGSMIADKDAIIDLINRITKNKNLTVLFVDELDSLDRKYFKFLNPILEEFKIGHKRIKPFVFIGASILKHELLNKCPDTMDRIDTQIKFERYTAEDIAQILKQYKEHLFNDNQINDNIYYEIGKNCKFNPRVAIAMMKDYIITPNLNEILADARIVYEGLTDIDTKILKLLSENKSMGAGALASSCGISEKEYTTEFEPYLVEFGYIMRGARGRKITDKGREIVEKIGG